MKKTIIRLCTLGLLHAGIVFSSQAVAECPEYQDHSFRKLHSQDVINLCDVTRNKAVLFVNTASHCGYTRQYSGLEALSQRYKNQGLVVVGFTSDDFNQESKDEAESAEICYVNHGVTFTMFAATAVTGEQANPVFAELATQSQQPRWNFNKYLVDKNGKLVKYFASSVEPDSTELQQAISSVLDQ